MYIKEYIGDRKLIVFGTGSTSIRVLSMLSEQSINVDRFTDNNKSLWGNEYLGIKVIPPKNLKLKKHIVLIASMYAEVIACQLEELGFKEHIDFLYPGNFFREGKFYKYIYEGEKLPPILKVELLNEFTNKSPKTTEVLEIIQQQKMNDLVLPKTLQNKHYPSFIFPQQSKPTGPINVNILKNGYTYDLNGAIFNQSGTLLKELSTYNMLNANIWDAQRIKLYDFEALKPKPINYKLKGNVAVTTTLWSGNNYYHWMFEELPRFFLLNKCGIEIDNYVSNYRGTNYQKQSLERMGINIDKIIHSSESYSIQADNLVVPYSPAFDSGYVATWVCDFLRETFIENEKKKYPKRIYISRGNTKYRKVLNECELIAILKGNGFEICNMDNYTLLEQANLFNNAEVIVGIHGAALSNLVYCQQGIKFLEIFNPIYVPTMYWTICSQIGIDYYFSLGERIETIFVEDKKDDFIYKDIIVNLEDINNFLKQLD